MRSERGSVSMVVAAIVLLALVLSVGVTDVARVLVARSHARTAADAAALAAAQELALPSGADPGRRRGRRTPSTTTRSWTIASAPPERSMPS